MNKTATIYTHSEPFQLERGGVLNALQIAYHTYGELNGDKSNVVWVFHALTANSDALDWWAGLFKDNCAINPRKHFIVCANILGSTYGTTGPMSEMPDSNELYYSAFPRITIRDMVSAHQLLQEHLGITKIAIGLGGSMGGFQTYEWAVQAPDLFEKIILVATSPRETPWRISIHTAQRMAIEADATWQDKSPSAGAKGVAASRAIGMLSYRNHEIFEMTQSESDEKVDDFKADSYMRYQGQKLSKRGFNGFLLWNMTKALDSHDIGRGRGGVTKVLANLQTSALVIGINSDLLFPIAEQKAVAAQIPNATFKELSSTHGHDGFLTETERINQLIADYI
jgi:homoserine O-acetyltransferase